MANERLPMRKPREILRLKWELVCSHRDVAASPLNRARHGEPGAGAGDRGGVELVGRRLEMSGAELDRRLFRRKEVPRGRLLPPRPR